MRVVVVGTNYPAHETFCPHWNGIRAGLARLPVEWRFVSCRPEINFEEISTFKPDLIVYGLLDMIKKPGWRARIKEENPGAKIVFWYGDLRNIHTGQIEADISDIDVMFVSNDAQAKFYKRLWQAKDVKFLPLGAEPQEPTVDPKFAFDFVFIGGQITAGAFLDRSRKIQRFIDEGEVTVFNSFEPELRAKVFAKMPTIYSSSKISLDISHFTEINKYTSIRYWEIPAFNGFALTRRFPGCEEFYPENIRAYFSTFEEAMEKKKYYLTNEKERQEMVRLAHEHSFNHTYDKRFIEMFKYLGLDYS